MKPNTVSRVVGDFVNGSVAMGLASCRSFDDFLSLIAKEEAERKEREKAQQDDPFHGMQFRMGFTR
ncbi:MAG: hypothetical protein K2W96_09480 [Gemmataceae bacterium]|nr:hypothetical protein [Gemmataceae bacterium]